MQETQKFLDLIKNLKLQYREDDKEIYVDCPLCTDTKKRMGISKDTGYFNCFNCFSKGKTAKGLERAIRKLKDLGRSSFIEYKDEEKASINQKLGQAVFEALTKNDEAKKYLIQERKLSKECIKHFKLGCRSKFKSKNKDESYDAGLHIALPYYENEQLVNIKYRAVNPQKNKDGDVLKWRRETGGKSSLFNFNVLHDHSHDTIIIAESEIDCMSIWTLGFENVVGLSIGAKGFKQAWYDLLQRFDKIYLVLDNDSAGREGAQELAKRLGLGRCFNVELPEDVKDPNDYIKKYTKEDFQSLLDKARRFEPKDVTDLKSKIKSMIASIGKPTMSATGLDTGWEPVNRILGKVNSGNLITVAARPKAGKTTLVMNWLLYLAQNNISSFNYQCEMEEEDMVKKYGSMLMTSRYPVPPTVNYTEEGEPIFKDNEEEQLWKETCKEEEIWLKSAMLKIPYEYLKSYHPKTEDLIDGKEVTALDKVCLKIKEVVQRFGCKVVVFDNLHFLCRGDKSKEQIDNATRRFKLLAKDLGVVFILVTHPKKTNHNRSLTNDDLKDSASIFQDSDAVILLHRPYLEQQDDKDFLEDDDGDIDTTQEGMMSPLTEVKVTARRHKGGVCTLYFNDDRALFKAEGNDYYEALKNKFKDKKKK